MCLYLNNHPGSLLPKKFLPVPFRIRFDYQKLKRDSIDGKGPAESTRPFAEAPELMPFASRAALGIARGGVFFLSCVKSRATVLRESPTWAASVRPAPDTRFAL
jgi:hypothetical protein